MSFNCKNDMQTKIAKIQKSLLLECHKCASADWHKVKIAFKLHQT